MRRASGTHQPVRIRTELMPRETLLNFFAEFGGVSKRFLTYDDGLRSYTRTYDDVSRLAAAFAVRLRRYGIRSGDKIILYGENSPEWIITFWGILVAGGIVVPIDYRSPTDFVRRVTEIVKARIVLTGNEVSPPQGLAPEVAVWPLTSVDEEAPPAELQRVTVSRQDTAEIIFTSGATAEPKGV